MVKKIIVVFLLLFATLGFSASQYDKDITVLNQSRNDKVVAVFKEMMKAYEEEDLSGFFSYVSEDRFIQDYMTFYDAIDKDMRTYDILNVDTWVDKITEDGIKRYLYVTWEKRYQSTTSDNELSKKGYSRFLFDEVNGKYKLIGLAGNNFWGESLAEWKEEVPEIAGQIKGSKDSNGLPDLEITNASVSGFKITNSSSVDVTSDVEWSAKCDSSVSTGTISGGIQAGETVTANYNPTSCYEILVYNIDPNNLIEESNEDNNKATVPIGGSYPSVSGSQPW